MCIEFKNNIVLLVLQSLYILPNNIFIIVLHICGVLDEAIKQGSKMSVEI
jgi:hypothetical protein